MFSFTKDVKYGVKRMVLAKDIDAITPQTINIATLCRGFLKFFQLISGLSFLTLLLIDMDLGLPLPKFILYYATIALILNFALNASRGYLTAMNILYMKSPLYRLRERINHSLRFFSINDKVISEMIKAAETNDETKLILQPVLIDRVKDGKQYLKIYYGFSEKDTFRLFSKQGVVFDNLDSDKKQIITYHYLSERTHPFHNKEFLKEISTDIRLLAKEMSGLDFTVSMKDKVLYHKIQN